MIQLHNTSWRLIAFVEGGVRKRPIKGTRITASFSADPAVKGGLQGTIGGSAGCNQYGANYTIAPGAAAPTIDISDPWRTLMACLGPSGVMEQESRYLQWLSEMTDIVLTGDKLILRGKDKALEFKAM